MRVTKIGLSDGVWGIAVRPEGAIEQTLKIKRMPDDFHSAFYVLATNVGQYIGEVDGINRLNSLHISYKKEGDYLGVWFQKSFKGISGFVKIDHIHLLRREDGELEQLLRNIDIEEDVERKEVEKRIYDRAVAVNMLCHGLAVITDILENKWDNLVKQGDDQLTFDFKSEEQLAEEKEKEKEIIKGRVMAFSEGEKEGNSIEKPIKKRRKGGSEEEKKED